MTADGADRLEPLRRDPSAAGIFTDFDGTVSPIVRDPGAAEPLPGVPELLDELARRYAVVAVISGRPVSFLAARLPASVLLVGLYGLETQQNGEHRVDPEAERWRPAVAEAAARSQKGVPPGVVVEPKGLSLTLHYRTEPALGPQVAALAAEVAAATGLEMRPARRSVELHPPVRSDKGTVVERLAANLGAACYLGDDAGDLQAFRALNDLAGGGLAAVRIAVRSDEVPSELLQEADVTVDGPEGAAALLATLLPAS